MYNFSCLRKYFTSLEKISDVIMPKLAIIIPRFAIIIPKLGTNIASFGMSQYTILQGLIQYTSGAKIIYFMYQCNITA